MSSHDAVSAVGAARAAFGGLTDRVRVGASRLTLKGEAKDLAVAVTKATNHDVVPPKEKHVQTLVKCLAQTGSGMGGGRDSPQSFALHEIAQRLDARNDWLVAAKALTLVHRCMSEAPRFVLDFARAGPMGVDKGAGGLGAGFAPTPFEMLKALEAYKDDSSAETQDYVAWIRSHAAYLCTRVATAKLNGWDVASAVGASGGAGSGAPPNVRTQPFEKLVDDLPRCHALVIKAGMCAPSGKAKTSGVVGFALSLVLRDTFRAYRVVQDGQATIADKYFDLSRAQAHSGLECYKSGERATSALRELYERAKRERMEYVGSISMPALEEAPASFIATMEEYARGAAPAAGEAEEAQGAAAGPSPGTAGFGNGGVKLRAGAHGKFGALRSTRGRNLLSSAPPAGGAKSPLAFKASPSPAAAPAAPVTPITAVPTDAFAALSVAPGTAASDPFAAGSGGFGAAAGATGSVTSPTAPKGANAAAAFADPSPFGDDAFGGSAFGGNGSAASPAAATTSDPFAAAASPAAPTAAASDPFAAASGGADPFGGSAFGGGAPAEATPKGPAALTGSTLDALYSAGAQQQMQGSAGSAGAPSPSPFGASTPPRAPNLDAAAHGSPFGAAAPSPYGAPTAGDPFGDAPSPFVNGSAGGSPAVALDSSNPFGPTSTPMRVPAAAGGGAGTPSPSKLAEAAAGDPFAALTSLSPTRSAMGPGMRR